MVPPILEEPPIEVEPPIRGNTAPPTGGPTVITDAAQLSVDKITIGVAAFVGIIALTNSASSSF
ncbi:hypothetical protein [Yoonia sp. 208BN28-4]|uniref:hypothetical protein n=1 Tax=Yoonia sp. 208BN28-4 TaxID=3126505 RepID=UPI00309C9AB4